MSEVIMGQAYTPAEAERGKFVVVNPSTLSAMGYPSGGYGKYAMLTYNIGTNTTVPGASSSNPLFVTQAGTNTVTVSTVSFNNTLSSIVFSPPIVFLEVYNNDASNKLYISYETLSTVSTLTARGLPISAQGYYSIERTISNLVIGSNIPITDARVFGHSIQ